MSKKTKAAHVTTDDIKKAWLEAFYVRHNGDIGPRVLLEDVRDPSCPFHDEICWDKDEALELYQLAQCAALLRRWRGVIIKIAQETKEVTITTRRRTQSPAVLRGKGKNSYRTTEDIMDDPELRSSMVQTVLRELMAYRRRYAELTELAEVWYAIDQAGGLSPRPGGASKGKTDKTSPAHGSRA